MIFYLKKENNKFQLIGQSNIRNLVFKENMRCKHKLFSCRLQHLLMNNMVMEMSILS